MLIQAIAGNAFVEALASSEVNLEPITLVWGIGTKLLVNIATLLIVYGSVVLVGACSAAHHAPPSPSGAGSHRLFASTHSPSMQPPVSCYSSHCSGRRAAPPASSLYGRAGWRGHARRSRTSPTDGPGIPGHPTRTTRTRFRADFGVALDARTRRINGSDR